MSQRRQYSSCDPCRHSKRRCFFSAPGDGETCTNCRRLGHACTFDFAKSRPTLKERIRKNQARPPQSTSGAEAVALGDFLAPWFEEDRDDARGLDLTDLLTSDVATPAQTSSETRLSVSCSPLDRIQHNLPFLAGSSLNSPIRLLSSKLDAAILDERLTKIYDTIITGCASRFADYNCNLYATASCYRLEGGDGGRSQEEMPAPLNFLSTLDPEMAFDDVACTMTAIGAVRFLDHFSGLYGNRLSPTARKQSDAALKAVLRTFSLQWLSMSETASAADTMLVGSLSGMHTTCDPSENAFYDSWFRARTLLRNAQSVRSFRIIYATLLFDGIAIPTKASSESAHEFLDIGLQKLCSLDTLVSQYYATLGSRSIYSVLLEASLTVVRWGGYIRDIGASLTTDRRCKLQGISGHGKTSSNTGLNFDWLNDQNFSPDLDSTVPRICQKAVAEAFCVWKQIVDVKNLIHGCLPSECIEAITSTMAAVGNFNQLFRPFINRCIENLECISIHSRTASVSIVLYWDLSVLILAESLETATRDNDPVYGSVIPTMRAYQEQAISSITKTVECVLSLPPEETFNLKNGLGAEVPITAYHITPSLTAAVYQKAIESIVYSQTSHFCAANSLQVDPAADYIWQRQIDLLLKGLDSLSVTVGGSEAATWTFQSLMPRYGDMLSECWSSDFST